MKNKAFFVFMTVMLAFASCDDYDGSTSENFNYSLQGTWETTVTPKVTLEIEYNSIKISGTIQTTNFLGETIVHYPLLGNYQGLRDIKLKGYSEESTNTYDEKAGLIFISVSGSWKDPISYRYWLTADFEKMLTLGTGTNEIFFKKQ